MHDPCTLAFDIYLGRKEKRNGHYRTPIISIWHKDPEKDGSDDSCGWFIRSRHIDPKLIERVRKEFAFNFQHNYWFTPDGIPKFDTGAVTLNMYSAAAWQIFMYLNNDKPNRNKYRKFMRKYLFDILYFAENPTDSISGSINMRYGKETDETRINEFTSIVTADIMRKIRPWYKHPRWHIHHWQITFPALKSFYRRYFEKCDRCHKKLGTQSVYTNWHGTEHWCEKCNGSAVKTCAQTL
jgi:hypothetical protein